MTAPESPPEAGVLRLVFQGFNPLEHKLIEGTVKLSQRRAPRLMILPVTRAFEADVVVVDARDPAAKAWAETHAPLRRKPVIWVDGDQNHLPDGHTLVRRPVPWTILPMLLARALEHGPESESVLAPAPTLKSTAAPTATGYSAGPLASRPTPSSSSWAGMRTPTPAASPATSGESPGAGASIPAVSPTFSDAANVVAAPPAKPDMNGDVRPSRHVLVVDDSVAMRAHSRTMLESLGYSVFEASSGETALTEIMPGRFVCVLMDVLMPGLSGYDTCKRIKDQSRTLGRVPVVMLTSRSSPFDRIRGKMAGCDGYLTKPVEAAALREALNRFTSASDNTPASAEMSAGTMKPPLFPIPGKPTSHQAQGI